MWLRLLLGTRSYFCKFRSDVKLQVPNYVCPVFLYSLNNGELPRYGKCCECVKHHQEHRKKLPTCLLGIEREKEEQERKL